MDIESVATSIFCPQYYEQLRGYIRCLIRFIREVDIRDNQDFLREFERYNDALKASNRFGIGIFYRIDGIPNSLRDRSMRFIEEESRRLIIRDTDYAVLLFSLFLRSYVLEEGVKYVLVRDEMGGFRGSRFIPVCIYQDSNLELNIGAGADSRCYRQQMRTIAGSIYDGTELNPKVIPVLMSTVRAAYREGDDPYSINIQEEELNGKLGNDIIKRMFRYDRTDYYFPFYIAELRRGIGPEGINRHNLEIVKCKEKERVHIDPERGF